MRQVILCVSILLLGLTWSVAQTSGSSEASPSGSSSGQSTGAQSGQMGHTAATGHTTVEGCLSSSNGSYTLTDKNGTAYQVTGDNAKLSEHVGHEVKITGTAGAGASSSGGNAGAMGGAGSEQTLHMTSLKHISKNCQASGGGMSH